MAIPLPFRDAATMKRLDPVIARGMRTTPTGPMRLAAFPEIAKPNAATAANATAGKAIDARPIAFSGNKMVVAEAWHPAMSPAALSSFSPWAHADTLTSIELVAAEPYYHQFDVSGDASVHQGLAIFRQSCQFCHGARKVGANFGWDFVEPTPIYSYHKPVRNLFYHVAYKPLDAAERGLMMPAMRFMTEADATLLWHWLRAVASRPMPPYMLTSGAHTENDHR
jgi:mono/diheme cytochrome c family protein